MRQVPHYLIIGSGRLATHFAHYLAALKLSYSQWSRQHHSLSDLLNFSEPATHLLFLVSDSAISELLTHTKAIHAEKISLHCSGRLTLPEAFSAHPLMTFSQQLYPQDFYQHIPFVIEKNGPEFNELLPGLPNPYYKIPAELKNYYHALCVMSGNFTTILWQKFFHELEHTFNLPAAIAKPYLNQITENLSYHPNAALTGPLARNDHTTIQANLQALENDSFQEIYEAFLNVFQQKNPRQP